MKLLLNSTCPMIHSSIIIVYVYVLYIIQWQASHGNWSCYANIKPTMQMPTLQMHSKLP
jgi:hypothetical protein